MPALMFGLKPAGSSNSRGLVTKAPQKRKGVFGEDADGDGDEDGEDSIFSKLSKGPKTSKLKLKPITSDHDDENGERPRKSPKLSDASLNGNGASVYGNLSAIRTAKLHDEEASKLDASVYDYDAVYDTFHAKPSKAKATEQAEKPKYMRSLMTSAETRKRDQLRAREKLLQKERENEGDEFADKEKFVTGAYKKAQEEMRKMEEEEKLKEEEEEERRRKGGGMEAFNRSLLQKEEERQKMIEAATEEARQRKERGDIEIAEEEEHSDNEDQTAQKLNARGAKITLNDEGEVLDKRQLLGAGLNVAPRKKTEAAQTNKPPQAERSNEWYRSAKARDAKENQRERQTRMVEQQIEEMTRKQQEADEAEKKELETKNQSKVTDDAKLSAKERFLQRKKEREAAKAKSGTG